MATQEEKKKKRLLDPRQLAGKFFAGRTNVGGKTRAQRIGGALLKTPVGKVGSVVGRGVSPVGRATIKDEFRKGGLVGIASGAREGARQAGADIRSAGERVLFGQEGKPSAPLADRTPTDSSFFANEASATRADIAGGDPTIAGAPRKFFDPKPTPTGREDLFPGAREAASMFGLKQLGESATERETRIEARIPRERTTATKEALQGELAGVKADRRRATGVEAQQAQQGLVNEGMLAQALQGNVQSMNEVRGKVQAAAVESRYKAFGDAISSVMSSQLLDDKQRATQIAKVQEIFSAGAEAGAEVGAEVAKVDVNGDGKESPDELEYNKLSKLIAGGKDKIEPADMDRMKLRKKKLADTLGLV